MSKMSVKLKIHYTDTKSGGGNMPGEIVSVDAETAVRLIKMGSAIAWPPKEAPKEAPTITAPVTKPAHSSRVKRNMKFSSKSVTDDDAEEAKVDDDDTNL